MFSKSVNPVSYTHLDVDYGFVGDVEQVDATLLSDLIHKGVVPVMAPLTHDGHGLSLIHISNAVHVSVNEKGYNIEQIIDGETVAEVLEDVYKRQGLANIYFNGELVEEDINRAKELLEKAIELGSGNAAYRLGWMYERGFLSEPVSYTHLDVYKRQHTNCRDNIERQR